MLNSWSSSAWSSWKSSCTGIFASNQASEKEVSYEPSTSHFNWWRVSRGRGGASDAGAGGGRDVDRAANGRWPAGPAGRVGLPHDHADGAARSAGNEGVFRQ